MTLVQDVVAPPPPLAKEPVFAQACVLEIPQAARTEHFPLFGRLSGAMWFGLLAIFYLKPAVDAVLVLLSGAGTFSAIVLVGSRLSIVVFYGISCWLLLARPPPVARHGRAAPVVTAFVGSYLVWLIPIIPAAPAWPGLQDTSAAIGLIGDGLVIYTLCKLGRSFSIAPQARKLVTSGPYRLVRHPLYATEEIALIGVLLQHVWWGALAFLAVHLTLQIRRMLYEESLLRAVFPDYVAYARRTARLIPGVW